MALTNSRKLKMTRQTLHLLRTKISQTEIQLRSVNERYCIKALEKARDFFKENDTLHTQKTKQLSTRQEYEKAIKPVVKALESYDDGKPKTIEALRNEIQAVYDREEFERIVGQKALLRINNSCKTCSLRIFKAAQRLTQWDENKQLAHVEKLIETHAAHKADLDEMESDLKPDKPKKTTRKRGRPKKTEKMAQDSGKNEPSDKDE